jgi:hypothetical protein
MVERSTGAWWWRNLGAVIGTACLQAHAASFAPQAATPSPAGANCYASTWRRIRPPGRQCTRSKRDATEGYLEQNMLQNMLEHIIIVVCDMHLLFETAQAMALS